MKKTSLIMYFRLFWIFFKAGTFTFAGGLAMLPVIQKQVIDRYHMMEEGEFLEYAALAQTLPGVIALNCGIFVGKHAGGIIGALAAGFGTILPAFTAMLLVAVLVSMIPQTGPIQGIFMGIRAASGALILSSAYSLGKNELKKVFPVILTILAFVLIFFVKLGAVPVVLGAGAAGLIYKLTRKKTSGEETKP